MATGAAKKANQRIILAIITVDIAENEPLKVWRRFNSFCHSPPKELVKSFDISSAANPPVKKGRNVGMVLAVPRSAEGLGIAVQAERWQEGPQNRVAACSSHIY